MSEHMRGLIWGVVVALGLAWAGVVSYGAWRGHLAASFLERTIETQQQQQRGASPGPQPPTAPPGR